MVLIYPTLDVGPWHLQNPQQPASNSPREVNHLKKLPELRKRCWWPKVYFQLTEHIWVQTSTTQKETTRLTGKRLTSPVLHPGRTAPSCQMNQMDVRVERGGSESQYTLYHQKKRAQSVGEFALPPPFKVLHWNQNLWLSLKKKNSLIF